MKIIVVDDKEVTRKCTSLFLENMGHQCRATSSGKETIKIIKNEGTDMVVTNLKMHKMNSFDILKILKHTYPEIKIDLLTGLANLESLEEAVQRFKKALEINPNFADPKKMLDELHALA